MPFSYDPNTSALIPEGVHELTVVSIEDTYSKSGNAMWIVRFEDELQRELTEWIVQTAQVIDWKFRPLWEAAGLKWPETAGVIDERELIDHKVLATIMHERSAEYGLSARIQGYAEPGAALQPEIPIDMTDLQPAAAPADDDDPLPF